MFEMADAQADLARVANLSADELVDLGQDLTRFERQAAARKIVTAHRVGQLAFERVLEMCGNASIKKMPEKAAVREVSYRLGVPTMTAGKWIELGERLHQLPTIMTAFLDGELSEHRARIIANRLAALEEGLRDSLAAAALGLARQPISGSQLGEKLDELIIEADPGAAAEQRDEFTQQQDVRISKEAHGHWGIDALVPLADGQYLKDRLAELIARDLCENDPRTIGQKRVAALAAIMRGLNTIECGCGHSDCPKKATEQGRPSTEIATMPTASVVSVVTDALTLAGLTGEMVPRVDGYGVIDPDLARALADDATWQGLYREARAGDETQGLRKGRPRRAGTIAPNHLIAPGPIVTRSRPPNDVGDLRPVDPSGHGGLVVPPTGALIYQPTDALRREVLLTDQTCRGPWCDHSATDCQFDHIVPFDHQNPVAGGWSVPANIAPLCIPCHQFKHLGLWIPVMYPGRIIVWRNATTGDEIITYP